MRVEIITTGDEIMSGLTRDANFAWAAAALSASGVVASRHVSVPDSMEDLADCFTAAAKRADFVVVSGGLGPTDDDLCARAAAELLDRPLVFSDAAHENIARELRRRGREPGPRHEKQSMLPQGADILDNPLGTACGFGFVFGNAKFLFLPGVPREFRRMFSDHVLPEIKRLTKKEKFVSTKILKVFGLGESEVAATLENFSLEGVRVGYRISFPEVHVRFSVSGHCAEENGRLLRAAADETRILLGNSVFAEDDGTLEGAAAALLLEKKLTISVAESCTGGLCASRFTDVSGSSGYFLGGVVAYSDDAKRGVLGVASSTLERFGAVSSETVCEMASGAREVFGSDIGVSISGVAGPSGGTAEKPVGTVWFGFDSRRGTFSEKKKFAGSREEIKNISASKALDMVRKFCMDYVE